MHDTSTIDNNLWSRYRALVAHFSFIEKLASFSTYGTLCPIMHEAERREIKNFYFSAFRLVHYDALKSAGPRLGRVDERIVKGLGTSLIVDVTVYRHHTSSSVIAPVLGL